jgi:hypothetical protein
MTVLVVTSRTIRVTVILHADGTMVIILEPIGLLRTDLPAFHGNRRLGSRAAGDRSSRLVCQVSGKMSTCLLVPWRNGHGFNILQDNRKGA